MDYCSRDCQQKDWEEGGHKVICRKAPKAIAKAEAKIDSFDISDYTTRNVGNFMVTGAQAIRGEIQQESEAQDMCYDAMEMESGSPEKLSHILKALKHFPISTEAWNMFGNFYYYEIDPTKLKAKQCSTEALKMYQNAVKCGDMLNPTWASCNELPWGELDNRPYLRAVKGYALSLHAVGRHKDAIEQAEKLLRWNSSDNQGVRQIVCTWYLQEGNVSDCLHILRGFEDCHDAFLAYTDLLVQFLRCTKYGELREDRSLHKALYKALTTNPHVPDLLMIEEYEERLHDYISPGRQSEADCYANDNRDVWLAHPRALEWVQSQKFYEGTKVPEESNLIAILKSGCRGFRVKCRHSNRSGRGNAMSSTIEVTQKRSNCIGCGLAEFEWPSELDRDHECSKNKSFLMHVNSMEESEREMGWRRTKYSNVSEVPFWRTFEKFLDEEE